MLALLLAAMMLAACTACGAKEATSTVPAQPAEPAEAPAESPKEVTINFWHHYSAQSAENETLMNVLIPRFDTECLIDAVLPKINDGDLIADICCGSGCIGLTLALEKNVNVLLADISPYALELSEKNTDKFEKKEKVRIVKHDVFNDALDGKYSLIVSNPPYIKSADMIGLSAEVKQEPSLALDGGEDGLNFYRHMISKYKSNLTESGIMAFECGYDQADAVSEIFRKNGFCNIKKFKDYNNIERVVVAENTTA